MIVFAEIYENCPIFKRKSENTFLSKNYTSLFRISKGTEKTLRTK